jgi:hypothetical protein
MWIPYSWLPLVKFYRKSFQRNACGIKNVKHDITAVFNNKAYITNWFKSALYALDTLLDLSAKIISISSQTIPACS